MDSDTTSEQLAFAQAAHEVVQRINLAQMALAFFGADERADRVTAQLHHVTELIGAMQERHASLMYEHEALLEQLAAEHTCGSGGRSGLMVESIGERRSSRSWGILVGALWVRLTGLVPLLVAVCVLVAVGMGTLGHAQSTVSASGAESSSANGSGAVSLAHVGDTIQVGVITCTLTGVAVHDADTQDTHLTSGGESIFVHVALRNVGSSPASYSRSDFSVTPGISRSPDSGELVSGDLSGVTLSMPRDSSSLESGELAPSDSVEGDLVFEALHGDHAAELTWQPSQLGDKGYYAWLLGV